MKKTPPASMIARRLQVFVVLFGVLIASNNLLPYVGLRDDSCQTMFSRLHWENGRNNHLFVPQLMVSDTWDYWIDVHADVEPEPQQWRARELVAWLNQPDRQLNKEAVRTVIRQLCDRGYRVALRYRGRHEAETHEAQACDDPTLSAPHRWVPVRTYETDLPAASL